MHTISVILVDDHKIFRDGFRFLLDRLNYVRVIGEASNGKEFLDLLEKERPDIIFMDINMPQLDGIEATKQGLEKYPDLKIIALTTFLDEEYLDQMLLAGVEGYMLKNSDFEAFEKAIQKVSEGGNYFSDEIIALLSSNLNKQRKRKVQPQNHPDFTEREKEILELICQGFSNKQIADITFLSPKSIEKYKSSLFLKTETVNTVNLVLYAIKKELVQL
ncbi:MAG: response regulator [Marinifilaceae bacterium]